MAPKAALLSLGLCVLCCASGSTPLNFTNFDWSGIKNWKWNDAVILKLGEVFGHASDPASELTRKELLSSFLFSLQLCQNSFDVAAEKMNSLVDVEVPNEKDEEGDSNFGEEIFNNENDNIIEDDLSDILDLKGELHLKQPGYVKDLEGIFEALNHACASLPLVFPHNHNRRPRSSEKIAQRLALALTKWAERWLNSFERKVSSFMTDCTQDQGCKETLEKLIKVIVESLRENDNYFGAEAWVGLEKTLDALHNKGSPAMDSLTSLQRAVLGMEKSLEELQEEASFAMAEGISKSKDAATLFGHDDYTYKNFDVLSNLLTLSSKLKTSKEKVSGQEIEVDTSRLVGKVPATFLSVAFGSSLIQEHWGKIKHDMPKFLKLSSALSPSVLRVGGSAANFLSFDPSLDSPEAAGRGSNPNGRGQSSDHPKHHSHSQTEPNRVGTNVNHPKHPSKNQFRVERNHIHGEQRPKGESLRRSHERCDWQFGLERDFKNFTMTGSDWTFLTDLVQELEWTLLFDLNQFWRDASGNWDPTNAKLLFQNPDTLKVPIVWQLGNEPNSYHHKFDWSVTPEQAAKDYRILRQIVDEANLLTVEANHHTVVGPDVTRPKHVTSKSVSEDSMDFLKKFLHEGKDEIDALTWHQYYMDGHEATVDKFLSSDILNKFPKQLAQVVSIGEEMAPGKPIWLTETASAWSGGAPGLSDRAVGGFPWLDKLGSAAIGGASTVFRQTLYGGCYALLDRNLHPHPDYWVSVLHKQLVGEGVLLPRVRQAPDSIRVYAHCLNHNHHLYKKGAVVIFGINLSAQAEKFHLVGDSFQKSSKLAYILIPPQGELRSRDLWLNGETLKVDEDGNLPPMTPYPDTTEGLEFIPWSMTFWVFPEAEAEVC